MPVLVTLPQPRPSAWVLAQMQAVLPRLHAHAAPSARPRYARYVAGELRGVDVRQALNAAQRLQTKKI